MSMMIRRHRMRNAEAKEEPKTLSEASASDTKPLTFTKTDINRMSKEKLATLAKEQGVHNVSTMSGNALKKVLMDKLGL